MPRTKPPSAAETARARAQARAYLAALPPATRRVLRALQASIRAATPDATDAFSYGIPGFRLEGRPLVWYAGWTRHVSLYPIGDALKSAFASELEGYETSKGTVRFPLDEPLPAALLKRIVRARAAEVRRTAA